MACITPFNHYLSLQKKYKGFQSNRAGSDVELERHLHSACGLSTACMVHYVLQRLDLSKYNGNETGILAPITTCTLVPLHLGPSAGPHSHHQV